LAALDIVGAALSDFVAKADQFLTALPDDEFHNGDPGYFALHEAMIDSARLQLDVVRVRLTLE